MNVGERLKSLRIKKGLTQEELGALLGVQKSAVNKYEAGVIINLKLETLKKFADLFGMSIDELIGCEECADDNDLYTRRKELGLTLQEVADIVGVSKATIQRYETGYIKNMKSDKVTLYAKALQVPIEYLLSEEGEDIVIDASIEALVQIQNNKVVVSSRQVAENFGKRHVEVLDKIREILVVENPTTKNMFFETTHEYRGQQFPEYLMNRDGFSLLVMGFTGKEALQWKIKYIQAFNEMEKRLNEVPVTNLGSVVKMMREIRERMKDQGCSPREIAIAQKSLCDQYGISLPECFIKPEETSLKDVHAMIDYIFSQPRGRGHKVPTYEDFIIEHTIRVKQIKEK